MEILCFVVAEHQTRIVAALKLEAQHDNHLEGAIDSGSIDPPQLVVAFAA